MFQNFWSDQEFDCKSNLDSLAEISSDTTTVDHMEHVCNGVTDSCKILDFCNKLIKFKK